MIKLIARADKVCNMGTPAPIDCRTSNSRSEDYKYCSHDYGPSGYTNDYWAGARKACDQIGMTLPDIHKLQALVPKNFDTGLPRSGAYWSSNEYARNLAHEHHVIQGSSYTP